MNTSGVNIQFNRACESVVVCEGVAVTYWVSRRMELFLCSG